LDHVPWPLYQKGLLTRPNYIRYS